MYDKDNLYILARFTDQTPLNNPARRLLTWGLTATAYNFESLRILGWRMNRTTHWTCWRGRDGADIMTAQYGKDFKATLKDAKTKGAQQAFTINSDGKGYIQELAIPWKLLTKDGSARPPRL